MLRIFISGDAGQDNAAIAAIISEALERNDYAVLIDYGSAAEKEKAQQPRSLHMQPGELVRIVVNTEGDSFARGLRFDRLHDGVVQRVGLKAVPTAAVPYPPQMPKPVAPVTHKPVAAAPVVSPTTTQPPNLDI